MSLLRLPPPDVVLACSQYVDSDANPDASTQVLAEVLRKFHPELVTWSASALETAWAEYEQRIEGAATFRAPSMRRPEFISYLYICQAMPVYYFVDFDPTHMGEAWTHFDAGTLDHHMTALFYRVPVLQSIFRTYDNFIQYHTPKTDAAS
ncbi:MAG: hypothetical protein Q7S87_16135 [Agitococcus sp.]|nr:hypothetical protein [Agitococcus sp.]